MASRTESAGRAAAAGLCEPVVVVLFLIAFFSALAGRSLDGLLLAAVAAGLAWDTAHNRRAAAAGGAPATISGVPTGLPGHRPHENPPGAHQRRPWLVLAGLTGGAAYAAAVGAFTPYSWPATAGVIGLAAVVVAIGWRGRSRSRPAPGRLPMPGTGLWAGLLAAGSAWELAAFLQQPGPTTASYEHPTISALVGPMLESHADRSAALAVWLVLGWYLGRR